MLASFSDNITTKNDPWAIGKCLSPFLRIYLGFVLVSKKPSIGGPNLDSKFAYSFVNLHKKRVVVPGDIPPSNLQQSLLLSKCLNE